MGKLVGATGLRAGSSHSDMGLYGSRGKGGANVTGIWKSCRLLSGGDETLLTKPYGVSLFSYQPDNLDSVRKSFRNRKCTNLTD